ncbi:MAG: iron complex outerrane recepter protein [Thermoanaerobaculia bacterium]|jgi:iron complex outermembrane receptor protein|nr:iron complex outerrane recepter protein [Thermoanaerobaculia bacterium]
MKVVRVLSLLLVFPVVVSAATLRGVVRAIDGHPVAKADVEVSGQRKTTDAAGRFAIDVAPGTYTVVVTCSGFQPIAMQAATDSDVVITLRPGLAESIVVSGIRAEEKTPVTKSDVDRSTIARDYYGQDIPLLLRDTPSIDTYAEAGVGGSGYSYITLRGISPTRINFTLDGVPLADSEDMTTYFADFPDLARSLQSIQVQRGVGTSTVGSPSFGGSINLESVVPSVDSSTNAEIGIGSFGSKTATVGYQSGALPGGYAFYTRLSADQSNGFRESSGYRARNLFVSASKQNEDSQLRITGFTAHEWTQQSFLAVDSDTLKENLRANPFGPNDRDSFGYDLAQLQYLRALSPSTNMTASAYYQRGYGWYDLQSSLADVLTRYRLDGRLLGAMVTMSSTRGAWTANYGLHANEFRREHTRESIGQFRDSNNYSNYGTKGEVNAFAKVSYDAARWHLFSDAQIRTTDFHYHGDVQIDPIRWTFFNPKLGARYDVTSTSGIYASAGLSPREPARSDLFGGEDNASLPYDLHAVRPERLLDFESGWDYRGTTSTIHANVYAMEFRNEIASTGELSPIGALLRRNVDRSYRRGIELEYSWQAVPRVRLRGNANVSRNRIHTWTQFYDVYDANGVPAGNEPITFHDVNPVLTPSLIVNQTIEFAPSSKTTFGLTARHVGRSYLDNTNNGSFVAPAFTTFEANGAIAIGHDMSLRIQINNLLNNKRVFPSGYSYLFLTPQRTIEGISYYYPQATRNASVMVDFRR